LPPGHVNALRDLSTYTPTRSSSSLSFSCLLFHPQPFSLSLKLPPDPSLRRLQRAFTDDALNPDLRALLLPSPCHLFPPRPSLSSTTKPCVHSPQSCCKIFLAENIIANILLLFGRLGNPKFKLFNNCTALFRTDGIFKTKRYLKIKVLQMFIRCPASLINNNNKSLKRQERNLVVSRFSSSSRSNVYICTSASKKALVKEEYSTVTRLGVKRIREEKS